MSLRIFLVGGFNGGAGRSLTAALLANGLHLQGRRTALVRQTLSGSVSIVDPIESTLRVPFCELRLPDRYVLPPDLTVAMATLIHETDERFMSALHELALAEVGSDGDVVVDLCCHERAMNRAALCEAAVVLVPARESVIEIDWAIRGLAHARQSLRYRGLRVPTLVAAIAPESRRASQMTLLSRLLRNSDPDREFLPTDPLAVVVEVPFLDGFFLESLYDERPIWDDPTLQRRCIAFAESVLERADAVTDMMWGAADEA